MILEVPVDLENLERQLNLALPSPPELQLHPEDLEDLEGPEFPESLVGLEGLLQ